jgi:hypothetical protein
MLLDDLGQYLHNNGVGVLSTSLFKGKMPPDPDNVVALFDTGGQTPNPDIPLKEPTFQVIVRNNSYSAGKAILDTVRSLLHQQSNVQLIPNGTYIYFILLISEGGHIGRDENQREEFSINFRCRTR